MEPRWKVLSGLGLNRSRVRPLEARARSGRPVDDLVQQQPVVSGDVLDVVRVLVAPLDLEGLHPGVDQGLEVRALVVVLERQQVLVEGDDAALLVLQGIGQATGLGAVAAVGAASGLGMADVALAGEGDAQGAVDEVLDQGVGGHGGAHGRDLRDGQLPGQDDLGEAHLGQEPRLLRGADVALGGGVQVDGREVQLQEPQVLDDEGVHAGVVEVLDQAAGGLQLVVVEDGVEGDVDAGVEAVGVLHQAGDLRHRVVRMVAGAEGRAADVDGVGPVQDRLAADGGGLGGGQKFQGRGLPVHGRGL